MAGLLLLCPSVLKDFSIMKRVGPGVRVHFCLFHVIQLFLQARRIKASAYLTPQVVTKMTKYEKVLCSWQEHKKVMCFTDRILKRTKANTVLSWCFKIMNPVTSLLPLILTSVHSIQVDSVLSRLLASPVHVFLKVFLSLLLLSRFSLQLYLHLIFSF